MKRWRAAQGALLLVILVAAGAQSAGAQQSDFGREIALPGLSQPACRDVYDTAVQQALAKLNYRKAEDGAPDRVHGLTVHSYLLRTDETGAERALIIGLKTYATRDTRIYLWGAVGAAEAPKPNPDLDAVASIVEAAVKQEQESPATFLARDLSYETYQLSCIDTASCVEILKALGYNTGAPAGPVSLAQLPAVFPLPFKGPASVVRFKETADKQPALVEDTTSAPENRLMILYHSTQAEEAGKLKQLLEETIDVPERQVLIEGMVIELTEDEFKELGATWDLVDGNLKFTFLKDGDNVPFVLSYNPELTPPAKLVDHLRATIRMIIQEGKAEILSSPSVLVLNNRNARIQVVRDTPILTSHVTFDITNVEVKFEPVGIVLNIKPRISSDDSTVTMQIVAEVSEIPVGQAIEISGQVVAPAIDRRIVETVARVHNNTPFIIGGLIRNENTRTLDRIPILSRIPYIGALFRHDVTNRAKREVIIVLTPRVVTVAGSQRVLMPKDTAQFDFLDNRLFRNSYRVKAEDVFDLGFLEDNDDIKAAFDKAQALVRKHAEYGDRSPFKEFAHGVIPGEDAVVIRMLYEVVRKLELEGGVKPESIIFFQHDSGKPDQFSVAFLAEKLKEPGADGKTPRFHFGPPYPKEVLVFRYRSDPQAGVGEAFRAPVADVEWTEVAGREDVDRLMVSGNRLQADYRYDEATFVIDTDKDLARLQVAIVLREVVNVNNAEEVLALRDFQVGRRIALPEIDNTGHRKFLVDHQVAEYFFKSDYYYAALKEKLEAGYTILDEALRREGM